MQSILFPYRPEPGEVIPIENETIDAIRRKAEDDKLVLWRNESGWVVSCQFENGTQVDTAFCGNGERPSITASTIASITSFVKLARNPARCAQEIKCAEEATKRRETTRLKRMQEKQEEYDDLCRFVRRRLSRQGSVLADMPWLKH